MRSSTPAATLLAAATAAILLLCCTQAIEENNRFCIHTEPMLLANIEKHVNPIKGDPHCELLATTLSLKEKESFLETMCKDHGSSISDDYHYLKLRNGELSGRGSYKQICSGKAHPLLAWVPYDMVQRNFVHELDPKERFNYIAKATDVNHEKTELCHFRHSDLVTNATESAFTCVVMIFEDKFYGLDANINVLVEVQPLMYEVRNVTYLPWVNSTASYKTHLGKTTLKNTRSEMKQIYGSISYAYVEKVKLNTDSVYGDNLDKLPLLFEHKGAVLELDANGVGGVDVRDKAYFGRVMDPKSSVEVEVVGQWAEHSQQFTADVYEYFGYSIKRFKHELHKGAVSFMLIESTEPIFDMLDSTHVASATLHTPDKKSQQFERLSESQTGSSGSLAVNITTESAEWEEEEHPRGGQPYPGFYPWFVGCACVVGVVILAVLIGYVRAFSQSQSKDKHEYKLAGV